MKVLVEASKAILLSFVRPDPAAVYDIEYVNVNEQPEGVNVNSSNVYVLADEVMS